MFHCYKGCLRVLLIKISLWESFLPSQSQSSSNLGCEKLTELGMNLGQEWSWKDFFCHLSTLAAAGILDPSSLISSFMSIPGGQNWSGKKPSWLSGHQFYCVRIKIDQETLFSILTWKFKMCLAESLVWGFSAYVVWHKIFTAKNDSNSFLQPEKILHLCDRLLAPCWAWKINIVSHQELRGELDKVIFQLCPLLGFFFLVYLKYA